LLLEDQSGAVVVLQALGLGVDVVGYLVIWRLIGELAVVRTVFGAVIIERQVIALLSMQELVWNCLLLLPGLVLLKDTVFMLERPISLFLDRLLQRLE